MRQQLTESFRDEVDRIAVQLGNRDFTAVAKAIRARTRFIIKRWRERCIEAMPVLDEMSIEEFENSIPEILDTLAKALEKHDVEFLQDMVHGAPRHGKHRFTHHVSPHNLLAEARILRSVLVLELREHMERELTAEEAASFHELFDIIGEYSVIAMTHERTRERDEYIHHRIEGMQRLADLGTLVAGMAHDASNLLMPVRGSLASLKDADVPPDVRSEIERLNDFVQNFQNLVTNLRVLSIDSQAQPREPADLDTWAEQSSRFYNRILPREVELNVAIATGLPKLSINHGALSQALFNLIRNAQQAISSQQKHGTISVRAAPVEDGKVDITVEDDGPGMPPAVRERCLEPFFGMTPGGSGVGLALVNALVARAGGSISIDSPPPGKSHGTFVRLRLNTLR